MDWNGVNYRTGLTGTQWAQQDNVSHVDKGVLRRRPGLRPSTTGKFMIAGSMDTRIIGITEAGAIQTITPYDAGAATTLSSPGAYGTDPGCFARFLGRFYWVRGDTSPLAFDTVTSTGRSVGITAPSNTIGAGVITSPASGMTAGEHIVQYRYKNSSTGFISNPSGAKSITVTTNQIITFTIGNGTGDIYTTAQSGVDKIVLEATLAGGAVFYTVTEVSNAVGTVQLTQADAIISAKPPVDLYGADGHLPMPTLNLLCEHRNRLFGVQRSSNLLGWSRPGYPESWDLTTYARRLTDIDQSSGVTAMVSFSSDLYIMTPYSMSRLAYVSDPADGVLTKIPTTDGAWNPRCVIQVGAALYGFGPTGVWVIRGIMPEHISDEVDPFLEANIQSGYSDRFFCWYSRKERTVNFAFVQSPETRCTRAVSLHLPSGKWSTRTWTHHVMCGVPHKGDDWVATYEDGLALETREATDKYGGTDIAITTTVETGWVDSSSFMSPPAIEVALEPVGVSREHSVYVYTDFQPAARPFQMDSDISTQPGVSYLGTGRVVVVNDDPNSRGRVIVPMVTDWTRCIKIKFVSSNISPLALQTLGFLTDRDTDAKRQ